MKIDVSAEICGMRLDPAILNASGIFSFMPVLDRLQGYFGGLVTKSISYHERHSYENPVFAQLPGGEYINAVGLSNPGYGATLGELEEHYPLGKPLIVSIFGSETWELEEMARGMEGWCDGFEVNMSCPHPRPGEKVGRVLGSDPEAVWEFVRAVKEATGNPVITKLSYSLDRLEESAQAAAEGGADAISSTNTIGPTNPYSPRIGYNVLANSVGGLSGPGIRDRGLDSVSRIRKAAPGVPIIGMGGIGSAGDIVEYVRAGADAVAMGSAFDLMSTQQVGEFMDSIVLDLEQAVRGYGARSLGELRE